MKNLVQTLTLLIIFIGVAAGQMTEQIYAEANISNIHVGQDKSDLQYSPGVFSEKVLNSRAKSNYNVADYLYKNISYPELAQSNFVEGKVIANVLIDVDGKIQEVSIIKSLGFGCDEEVIKTLKAMPQWVPAIRNGEYIAQNVTIPVQFRMQ